MDDSGEKYRYLIVDSGPIIKLAGANLRNKALQFYTVPAVLQEIRDAKARQHLEQLPFELIVQDASPAGVAAAVNFARQTGDLSSLSSVDFQVLGLLYDLESRACSGNIDHVRKTPKRTLGVGKIELLCAQQPLSSLKSSSVDKQRDDVFDERRVDPKIGLPAAAETKEWTGSDQPARISTWALVVNPLEASSCLPQVSITPEPCERLGETALLAPFGQMKLAQDLPVQGQFSDASSSDEESCSDDDYDEAFTSDEEAEAYIFDPEELSEAALQEDLKSEFPSLEAACLVPYEGDDDDDAAVDEEESKRLADEERKRQSLQPISKSGKLYNSFRNYGELMSSKPVTKKEFAREKAEEIATRPDKQEKDVSKGSHIIGGLSGQDNNVQDDGEGWITNANDIRSMKVAGALDPSRNPDSQKAPAVLHGPPVSQRAACATTDFAMQNVILQMNLELLSVDGMKVRTLKTWVTRCGACFKVYTSSESAGPLGSKRLFCERCGSDLMQRIAASVDGKTGRMRLHLSKKYKHNLRGTKFSLPKPGTGNRFHGDLLLREDQLLMGAWNQKVKMGSGGKARKAAQSMFGADITTNVGCHNTALNSDIKVGFGRRNPNAVKGRERRGKKKKTADKACGLRRY
jgi:RNA-binding protein NOB1